MQIGKPIFALSPSVGTMKDMFDSRQIDYFADVTDYMAIAKEISRIYDDFNNKSYTFKPKDCKKFGPANYIEVQQYIIWKRS